MPGDRRYKSDDRVAFTYCRPAPRIILEIIRVVWDRIQSQNDRRLRYSARPNNIQIERIFRPPIDEKSLSDEARIRNVVGRGKFRRFLGKNTSLHNRCGPIFVKWL